MNDLVLCERSDLVEIADAVRSKTGIVDGMTLGQIANEIESIGISDVNVKSCAITLDINIYGGAPLTLYYTCVDGNDVYAVCEEMRGNVNKTIYCLSGSTITLSFCIVSEPTVNTTNLINVLLSSNNDYDTAYLIPESIESASIFFDDNR